ncbi:MAG: PEP/pyruvate-binding domain-containing protein [Woeseia sp.]
MAESQRGPYSRIRWFCNDGTVQAPVAYACTERGGGRQHGEYSAARQRLAELGWSVGTVFAALSFDELFDADPRHVRLRELPLERYLIDIDDGWVLRRAQGYRGRVQIEDEEAAGRELLQQVLQAEDWSHGNFLLVREAARVIPHGNDTDLARTVRRAAIELAELEPSAERWRAEIHGTPGKDISQRLRRWTARQKDVDVVRVATQLADDLDQLYGPAGVASRVRNALAAMQRSEAGRQWRNRVNAALELPAQQQIPALCSAVADGRETVFGQLGAAGKLALLDAMQEIETSVQTAYTGSITEARPTRAEFFELSSALLDCTYGSGLLSARERSMLKAGLSVDANGSLPFADYRRAIARLKRAPGWALGTVRYTFAEPLIRYTALDPRAARFSDDVLRGSPLWMLGSVLKTLSQDVDQLSGSVVEIAGTPVSTALALNTGIAVGTLRIFATIEEMEHATLNAKDIVALPETIAELSPVAGILTLGEGNALSHVQLLARNFGIPNIAIDFPTIDLLKPLEGQEVLLVVDSAGNVVLRSVDDEVREALRARTNETAVANEKIKVPLPKLGETDVLPLAKVGRKLSGKVVGPKAANLGELNRLFPGRVAPAIAIPFGIYARHLQANGLDQRIAAAFAGRADGSLDEAAFDAEIANVRTAIAGLTIQDDTREQLVDMMQDLFGDPGTYGVFVRSDTNVEDLPQFTGAGLNETVPNVVGLEAQLTAVPRVWSSVLSPRALAWRSSVLANPERIYASVLLMKSVPSTKSGVLVTRNVFDRNVPGMTASAAWGVGGAVAGEAAESIVILDESIELISDAKSPYQRNVTTTSGVGWLPADAGTVLQPAEIEQLRALAEEVNAKYEPALDENGVPRPWDIEFGFVEGELTLFQIRPLVEKASRNADALLRRLQPDAQQLLPEELDIALDQVPGHEDRNKPEVASDQVPGHEDRNKPEVELDHDPGHEDRTVEN